MGLSVQGTQDGGGQNNMMAEEDDDSEEMWKLLSW